MRVLYLDCFCYGCRHCGVWREIENEAERGLITVQTVKKIDNRIELNIDFWLED